MIRVQLDIVKSHLRSVIFRFRSWLSARVIRFGIFFERLGVRIGTF